MLVNRGCCNVPTDRNIQNNFKIATWYPFFPAYQQLTEKENTN